MSDNPLEAALSGEPDDALGVVGQPAQEAPSEPAASAPERGPDGKFLAKAPESQPAQQAAPEAPLAPQTPAPAAEPAHAPLSALLDEREKRQAAERRAQQLQSQWEEAQRANLPPPTPQDQFQAELYAQRLDMSRMFAESRYGAEEVAALHDWAFAKCAADPLFNEQMRSSRNPYEEAAQARNREIITAKVTPDRLAAFEAWEQAQAQAAGADPAPSSQSAVAPPPRSLAQAPGSGLRGNAAPIEIGEGAAFAAAIR